MEDLIFENQDDINDLAGEVEGLLELAHHFQPHHPYKKTNEFLKKLKEKVK